MNSDSLDFAKALNPESTVSAVAEISDHPEAKFALLISAIDYRSVGDDGQTTVSLALLDEFGDLVQQPLPVSLPAESQLADLAL